jgi:tripartite-type tricarboxylate transporter receptor subunit TctC
MGVLALATAVFLLTHFIPSTPLRPRLVAALGEGRYRGLYVLVAFVTLGWMIRAYAHAPAQDFLWTPLRHVPLLVMPFALILVVGGLVRMNPTAVGAERLLKEAEPARGMVRITRHPFMWGAMLWAAAHILANADAKSRDATASPGARSAGSGRRSASRSTRRSSCSTRGSSACAPTDMVRLFLCSIAFAASSIVQAQGKPVHLLVGFAPGGANDILARIVAPGFGKRLGVPVVVENRPGNAGLIATEALAKSAPDGTTLMIGSTGTQTMAPHLVRRLPYDAVRDLAPVGLIGATPNALVVRPSLPVQDVRELIELAKRRPGFLTYASSGNGTTLHLAGALFAQMADVELVHVSYKGNAPALQDVMGERVDMIFSALPPLLPLAKAGKLRILGVASPDRIASAPDIPTVAEEGLAGYESSTWYGLFAPGATPAQTLDRLSKALLEALRDGKVREALDAQGVTPKGLSREQFGALFAADYARWGKVIREANIKPD